MNKSNDKPRRAQLSGRVPREFRERVVNYSRWTGEPVGELMRRVLEPIVTPTPTRTRDTSTEVNRDE